jgi:hypothetical protein
MTRIRTRGRPFRKGQSGNPGGRPRVEGEIRELARQHTGTALRTLVEIAERVRMRARASLRRIRSLIAASASRQCRLSPPICRR